MPDVRRLRDQIRPSSTDTGDGRIQRIVFSLLELTLPTALSALIVAIHMISSHCKQLKYIRKIVLITNGERPMETSDLESIASKAKEDGIEIVIL